MNSLLRKRIVLGAWILFFLLASGCRHYPSLHFGAYSEAEKFYEKGQYEKAIAKYEEFIRENPKGNMTVISYYYMAKSNEALRRYDEARRLYQKIINEYSGLVWVDFAKARLEEMTSEANPRPL